MLTLLKYQEASYPALNDQVFLYRLEDTFAFHRWKYLHLALDDIVFCSILLLTEYIINCFITLLQDSKAIANSLAIISQHFDMPIYKRNEWSDYKGYG